MQTLRLFAAALIVALAAPHPASAQPSSAPAWPQRTVRLILPLGPGSATDVTARLYAEKLSERWGKPVVVENRPGPDALLAVAGFLGARDQHTLLFSFGGPVTINPVVHEKLPYDPERDLVPIVSASDSFIAVATTAALNIDSVAALVQRAKAEPGKLNWAATAGLPQFGFAGFAKGAGLDMVQVSYRDFAPRCRISAKAASASSPPAWCRCCR